MFFKQLKKLYQWYMRLSVAERLILGSVLIWALQAIPKWSFVLLGDGEMAANLMTYFITPYSEQMCYRLSGAAEC
ncbi:MAG: hypothetical protein JKY01_08155 [Pseudomonadales bacterium]|nr:hypothetical protein [Pseudomonadales bacterium]